MTEGGCNCGQIHYKCEGDPIVVAQCHCRNCQRQSGSAFSVNLLLKGSQVTLEGELTTYEDKDTLTGNPVLRQFCGTCGSPIFSVPADGKGMMIVKLGTLDDPSPFKPGASVWTSTAMPWVEPAGKYKFEQNA